VPLTPSSGRSVSITTVTTKATRQQHTTVWCYIAEAYSTACCCWPAGRCRLHGDLVRCRPTARRYRCCCCCCCCCRDS